MTLSSSRTGTPVSGSPGEHATVIGGEAPPTIIARPASRQAAHSPAKFRHRAAEWIAAFAGRLAGRPGVGCTKLDRCGDELAKVADVADNQFGSSKLGENASAHLRGKCRRLQVHQSRHSPTARLLCARWHGVPSEARIVCRRTPPPVEAMEIVNATGFPRKDSQGDTTRSWRG